MTTFEQIIKKGDLCFDIGANNGNKSDLFLSMGARVVCVEPQIACFNILNSKYANRESITMINKAVGASAGKAKMFIASSHTLTSLSPEFISETKKSRFSSTHWDSIIEVDLITMDELILQNGLPSFCKIDVEGYESEVLLGLSTPIKFMSVEFTPELKHKTFECMDIIKKIGNYNFNYSEAETNLFHFGDWVDEITMRKFLLQNNDFKVSFGDLYMKNVS